MSWSINEWFEDRGGRGSESLDDERVEYEFGHPGSTSPRHSGGTGGGELRGGRRALAGRSGWRTPASRGRASDSAKIRQRLLQAQRDGQSTTTAAVVAALARRGVRATAAQVEASKADLRSEARKARTSVGKSEPKKLAVPTKGRSQRRAKGKPAKGRIVEPVRVEFRAPHRTEASPARTRSEGIERGPAELSPFRSPAPDQASRLPRPQKSQPMTAAVPPTSTRRRSERRDGQGRRLTRLALPVIEAEPCPACGLRPTINGVCLC